MREETRAMSQASKDGSLFTGTRPVCSDLSLCEESNHHHAQRSHVALPGDAFVRRRKGARPARAGGEEQYRTENVAVFPPEVETVSLSLFHLSENHCSLRVFLYSAPAVGRLLNLYSARLIVTTVGI